MKKTTNVFSILGYIYLTLPILIFFIGWCNPLTAVLGSVIILLSLFFACKNAPEIWRPDNKKQVLFVISIFLISLFWVYLSGIGGLVFQNSDHNVRNSIFEMLVVNKWPVLHSYKPAILTYYIAFWLPSALVGKLFHSIQIGYYFQVIWATVGVFLFFYHVLAGLRKKNYVPIILFILFSGLDFIGVQFSMPDAVSDPAVHLEWWAKLFQYSSMTTQLFWVFNQAIAAWLIVSMFCLEKNNKNIIFLYSCLFLHSTLPAIGMFPFVVYWVLKNGQKRFSVESIKNALKSVFSIQNIIGGLTVMLICGAYLSANVSGGKVSNLAGNRNMLAFIIWLSIFLTLEVGIYLVSLFKLYSKKIIYYLTAICLMFYPVITVGSAADFCMRASIPALIILYLMICKAIESRYFCKKCELAYTVLFIALCIGAFTPMHEFSRTIYFTTRGVTKQQPHISFDNFYGWERDNKFLKYFGKNIRN